MPALVLTAAGAKNAVFSYSSRRLGQAAVPRVVINTCYFPFLPFQSIDKSRVRPSETMGLSSAPSDVV